MMQKKTRTPRRKELYEADSDLTTAFEREMVASVVEELEDTLDVQDVEDLPDFSVSSDCGARHALLLKVEGPRCQESAPARAGSALPRVHHRSPGVFATYPSRRTFRFQGPFVKDWPP